MGILILLGYVVSILCFIAGFVFLLLNESALCSAYLFIGLCIAFVTRGFDLLYRLFRSR